MIRIGSGANNISVDDELSSSGSGRVGKFQTVRIISGTSNRELAEKIAAELNIPLTKCDITTFSNSETRIQLRESVRGQHVYIVQTGGFNEKKSINDYLMETMLIMDSVRGAGAKDITLLCPCYPYARQDKKDSPRAPISSRVVANMLEGAGMNRLVCVDLHAASIQGLFYGPCDNLYCINPIQDYLNQNVFIDENGDLDQNYTKRFVAISPDEGAVKRVRIYSNRMSLKFMVMSKDRDYKQENVVEETVLLGNPKWLKDRTAIIFDDMIDTGGTMIKSVDYLVEKGAKDAIVVVSHGILSGPALDRINSCESIRMVLVSDSLPQTENMKKCPKIRLFTVSGMYADVVRRLATGKSISELFE